MRFTEIAQLARWLGPWSDEQRAPAVECEEIAIAPRIPGERGFSGRRYRPRRRTGAEPAVLLIPGLHYAGPFDPRLDRFARILAASGKHVLAPHLPDFEAMVVAPSLIEDAQRALDALLDETGRARAGVMSISFGVLPAAAVAARNSRTVSSLVTFGGYGDFDATLRFCLLGGHGLPHDPLNRPALFLNLLDHLPAVCEHERLAAAWRSFMQRTWGRPEMKAPDRYRPIAEQLVPIVHDGDRELFLQGCSAAAGGEAVGLAAIESAHRRRAFEWLDPRPHLREVRVPVTVVHGRDDDVIPYPQAKLLASATSSATRLLTGMYSHSGASALRALPEAGREAYSMLRILKALAELGRHA